MAGHSGTWDKVEEQKYTWDHDVASEYTDTSETISEASSTFQFDERVTSGVRKLSHIEFKRTFDNAAVRPLFKDRDIAKDMLSFELSISDRPLELNEETGEYEGLIGERVLMSDDPLTPLGEALDECIERRRHHRRKIVQVPLAQAAQKGDVVAVKALLERQTSANIDGFVHDEAFEGFPGLIWSSLLDHKFVVQQLLVGNCDPNIEDNKGWTALMWAAHQNNAAILRMLLERGANPNHRNRHGSTALTWAAEQGNTNALKLLLNAGVDLEQVTNYGNTALMQASAAGHSAVVNHCLQEGAKVNTRNEELKTALTLAADGGHVEVVKSLLSHREIETSPVDQYGQTPMSLAQLWNSPQHQKITKLLAGRIEVQNRAAEDQRKLLASQQSNQRRRRLRRARRMSDQQG